MFSFVYILVYVYTYSCARVIIFPLAVFMFVSLGMRLSAWTCALFVRTCCSFVDVFVII